MSQAIINGKKNLVETLIKKKAKPFYEDIEIRDFSPFFLAINHSHKWAIEMMCDHGANINIPSKQGMIPILYAATKGYYDICMYLSLRTSNEGEADFVYQSV